VTPDVKSVEVHSQLSCNGHPVDGVLVGASLLWVFTRIFFGGDISPFGDKKTKGAGGGDSIKVSCSKEMLQSL
jgi:hypothetical protein